MQPPSTFSYKLHALTYSIDKMASGIVSQNSHVSFPQFLVVLCYVDNPGESQSFGADWLQLTEATISYMIKKLTSRGYLDIMRDEIDNRKRRIYPTKKSILLIKRVYPLLEKELARHLACVPKHRLDAMVFDINDIYNSINNKQ